MSEILVPSLMTGIYKTKGKITLFKIPTKYHIRIHKILTKNTQFTGFL